LPKELDNALHSVLHKLWLNYDDSKSKAEFCRLLENLSEAKNIESGGKHGSVYWLKKLNPNATKRLETASEVCDAIWEDRTEAGKAMFSKEKEHTLLTGVFSVGIPVVATLMSAEAGDKLYSMLTNEKDNTKPNLGAVTGIVGLGIGLSNRSRKLIRDTFGKSTALVELTRTKEGVKKR